MRQAFVTLALAAWIGGASYAVLTTSLDWPFIVAPVLVALGLAGYGIIVLMVYFVVNSITHYGKTAQVTDDAGLLPDIKRKVRRKTQWEQQADIINTRDDC